MSTVGYLDLIGGMSGDMLIGAMLDVGLDLGELNREVRRVVPDGWRIDASKVRRGSVPGTHADVVVEDDRRWDWDGFHAAVRESSLPVEDRGRLGSVFECLRVAEAEAHGGDSSHLHELGTTDTLVDAVASVVGLRLLGVARLFASPLQASIGVSRSSHGVNASFAPATMAIIRKHGLKVSIGGGVARPIGESLTPTGAALVATLTTRSESAVMSLTRVGYGAGKRDSDDPPNVAGLWIGESSDAQVDDGARPDVDAHAEGLGVAAEFDKVILEANIDDSTPEVLGYARERLFAEGALDVWVTPIQMKKDRPGFLLSALVSADRFPACAEVFLRETSTFGARYRQVTRLAAGRELVEVQVDGATVQVKLKVIDGNVVDAVPEYDDCAEVARSTGRPLELVMTDARHLAWQIVSVDGSARWL